MNPAPSNSQLRVSSPGPTQSSIAVRRHSNSPYAAVGPQVTLSGSKAGIEVVPSGGNKVLASWYSLVKYTATRHENCCSGPTSSCSSVQFSFLCSRVWGSAAETVTRGVRTLTFSAFHTCKFQRQPIITACVAVRTSQPIITAAAFSVQLMRTTHQLAGKIQLPQVSLLQHPNVVPHEAAVVPDLDQGYHRVMDIGPSVPLDEALYELKFLKSEPNHTKPGNPNECFF